MIAHKIKQEKTGFEVYIWNGVFYKYIKTCKTMKEAEKLVESY